METATMGRVLTDLTVFNLGDLYDAERGRITADQVRRVAITGALVDSGASTLGLTADLIDRLGLSRRYTKRVRTAGGPRDVNVCGLVRVEIMGREAFVDPMELPDGSPVLVGQLVLEAMDWVIDMTGHRLIGNPEHGGEQMLELWTFLD